MPQKPFSLFFGFAFGETLTAVKHDVLLDLRMLKSLRAWFLWPFITVPACTLAHELGHWTMSKWFHFSGVVLHYSSTSDAGDDAFEKCLEHADLVCASAVHPLSQMAIVSAAGPAVSYALLAGAVVLTIFVGARPAFLSVIAATGLRFVIGPVMLLKLALAHHEPIENDETVFAWLAGIPTIVPALSACICLVAAVWAFSKIPRPPGLTMIALASGAIASMLLYFLIVGPLLLP